MSTPTNSIFRDGAVLIPDFITAGEEERIIHSISYGPWLTELRRRVQHYGYRYDYARTGPPQPGLRFNM